MAKQHFLVSPFGELNLTVHPSHVHIEASDQLAGDWGLGWWHAHHAGDEAVFGRAFWGGRLGAEPKPSPGKSEVDAFMGQWDLAADLGLETSRMPAGLRSRVQAYVRGFNQARRRRPKEAPWTPEDCHLLVRGLGLLEWWETRAPQIRFLIEAWQRGLTWDRVLDLWPGLGAEPSRTDWEGLALPVPFTAEAQVLVNRIRRYRPGPVWTVPADRSSSGRPLLAGSFVTDVTEPGLPFLPVRVDSPTGSVRGLSRPGHPGFFSGRTGWMAWHVVPAVDDTVDWRRREDPRRTLAAWAGAGRTGTLEGLLTMEESPGVDQARDRVAGLGSACLDFTVVDTHGQVARWAQGPRWVRTRTRDAWLPVPWSSEVGVGPRAPLPTDEPAGKKQSAADLEAKLAVTRSDLPDGALAVLRFLLPETEAGQRLRKWTGLPERGPDADAFERLYGSVLECFWESSPLVPDPGSPEAQVLAPTVDRLVQAPHSAWMPSQEKNHRLGEAVRRAFAPGRPPGPPVLGRRAPKACWTEVLGGRPRIFASTVAVVADPGEPGWRVFLTDDETEVPRFLVW